MKNLDKTLADVAEVFSSLKTMDKVVEHSVEQYAEMCKKQRETQKELDALKVKYEKLVVEMRLWKDTQVKKTALLEANKLEGFKLFVSENLTREVGSYATISEVASRYKYWLSTQPGYTPYKKVELIDIMTKSFKSEDCGRTYNNIRIMLEGEENGIKI